MTKKEFIRKFHNLVGTQQEENLGDINRIINEHDKEWDSRRDNSNSSSSRIIKRIQRDIASVVSIVIRTKTKKLSEIFDDIASFKDTFSIYEFAAWL